MVQVRALPERSVEPNLSLCEAFYQVLVLDVLLVSFNLIFLLSSGGQEDCILSYEPVTRQESKFHLLFCHCSLYFSLHILGASRAVSFAVPAPDSLWLFFLATRSIAYKRNDVRVSLASPRFLTFSGLSSVCSHGLY